MDSNTAWFSRVKREYAAGQLTATEYLVMVALGHFESCRFGIFPSHEALARRARCSISTVQRALQAARGLGLIEWAAQRIKAAWRSLRASNRYVLKMPAAPVQPGPHGPNATAGQKDRRATQPRKQEASERSRGTLAAMLEAARGLPDLLAARRQWLEGPGRFNLSRSP